MDDDFDVLAETGERLVNGIVHDFVHEVVKTSFAGVTDVHCGAFANSLDALQFLDFVGGVFLCTGDSFHVLYSFLRHLSFPHWERPEQCAKSAEIAMLFSTFSLSENAS
jgi:hypothetical protein